MDSDYWCLDRRGSRRVPSLPRSPAKGRTGLFLPLSKLSHKVALLRTAGGPPRQVRQLPRGDNIPHSRSQEVSRNKVLFADRAAGRVIRARDLAQMGVSRIPSSAAGIPLGTAPPRLRHSTVTMGTGTPAPMAGPCQQVEVVIGRINEQGIDAN